MPKIHSPYAMNQQNLFHSIAHNFFKRFKLHNNRSVIFHIGLNIISLIGKEHSINKISPVDTAFIMSSSKYTKFSGPFSV